MFNASNKANYFEKDHSVSIVTLAFLFLSPSSLFASYGRGGEGMLKQGLGSGIFSTWKQILEYGVFELKFQPFTDFLDNIFGE